MILEALVEPEAIVNAALAKSRASKGIIKPEPKSSVGTLLTGAAIGGLGLLALGALAGSSDEKESQKAAGQISTGKNKVKK
ncbi:MAG: hypothetical protein J6U18_02165 [Acetobacter sp.]|nr:hypothetical protein [Acetobacter sp.]